MADSGALCQQLMRQYTCIESGGRWRQHSSHRAGVSVPPINHRSQVESMSRDKRIRLSEVEKTLLNELRKRHFGGDQTPYGHVVAELVRFYEAEAQGTGVKL